MNTEEQGTKKRSVNRSPKHPALALEAAIEHASSFYKSAWDNSVGVDAACEIWALSYGSGTGNRTVSALLQFGLLEAAGSGKGRKVKITKRGLAIVTDSEGITQERRDAVRAAALAPTIYRKVWERWGPRLPGDRVMTPELVRDFGFNPNSITDFLRDFRATVELAGLDKLSPGDQIGGEEDARAGRQDASGSTGDGDSRDHDRPSARPPMGTTPTEDQIADPAVRLEDYTIPLRGAGTAVLSIPVPLSRRNYDKLRGWLEWAEDSLVREGDDDGNGGGA